MTMELTKTIHDPDAFAKELYSALSADCAPGSPLSMTRLPEYAAYEAAERLVPPALLTHETDLGAAVMALALACHADGVRFGIAAETLRRQLLNRKES